MYSVVESNPGLDRDVCFLIFQGVILLLNILLLIIRRVFKYKNAFSLGLITYFFNIFNYGLLFIFGDFFYESNNAIGDGFLVFIAQYASFFINGIILIFYNLSFFDRKKIKEKNNNINKNDLIIDILYVVILIELWIIIFLVL